jgi:protein-S-isoprenylcysteine O-methyltransferase Ste14
MDRNGRADHGAILRERDGSCWAAAIFWRHLQGKPQTGLQFTTPFIYRIVRHPLYVGWFFAFWSAPVMTATHLLFAMVTTAYILAAIQLEERDLMAAHPEYAAYRDQVPMIVPGMPQNVIIPAALLPARPAAMPEA